MDKEAHDGTWDSTIGGTNNVSEMDLYTIIMTYHARCAHKRNEVDIQMSPTFAL